MELEKFYKAKKVLLTGDTGFKGSWLAIWLSSMGAEVYGYALPAAHQDNNYEACNVSSSIHHTDGDIRDKEKLMHYMQEVKPDIAFHLAAQPLVLDSYADPVYTYEVNVMGTVNFLEALRKSEHTRAAVVVTTDKCYKNNEWAWGYREIDPLGGKDPYSASKACSEIVAESYIHSFFGKGACKIATARAGNVIGGGDWADNRIVPDFFRAYKNGHSIELRNPAAIRPWQHVLEPLYGYLLLGYRLYQEDGDRYCGAWNFGPQDKNHVTVQALIETLISITGKPSYEMPAQKAKLHEATFLKLDISKALFHLQWSPLLDLYNMMRFTAEGYLAQIEQKNVLENRLKQIQAYSALIEKLN